jgi:hypothetical protein
MRESNILGSGSDGTYGTHGTYVTKKRRQPLAANHLSPLTVPGVPARSRAFPLVPSLRLLNIGCKQVDRDGQKSGRIVFAGDLFHGLQETELQRDRLSGNHGRSLN